MCKKQKEKLLSLVHYTSEKERQEKIQKLNEYDKQHPEPLLWWLHESEQLKEKLSKKDIQKINRYVREHPESHMWEITERD